MKSVSLTYRSDSVRNIVIVKWFAFRRKAMNATIEKIENTAILSWSGPLLMSYMR